MVTSAISDLTYNMERKIEIFESKIQDGIMSNDKIFYPNNLNQKQIDTIFLEKRIEFGKKLGIDGKKIYRATQKNNINKLEYPDGKYYVINPEKDTAEDYWYLKLEADILILPYNAKKIAVAHQMADCPILIAEDRKKNVTAISHCGAVYINRMLPAQTITALCQEFNSKVEDIFAYIGSCAHKESYKYDKYPSWATNKELWKDTIEKGNDNYYYIDMPKTITKQLQEIGIKNIEISLNDTITNKE